MPYGHFRKLVEQAVELDAKLISLFGYGEPLMDGGLADKIALCTLHGIDTFITTNGAMLTEKRSTQLLEAGLKKIRFSVHGMGDNYEKVHRGLQWDKTFDNIVNFLAINEVEFFKRCRTATSVIPMHGECHYLFRVLWEGKVDELEIWKPHNWGNAKEFRDSRPKKNTCGRPWKGPVQINADGTMMVCCFDFDSKMVVGDTYKDSIETILKSEPFEKIRWLHKNNLHKGLPCEFCDQRNEYEESPLLYSNVDPECEIGKTSSTKFKLEK
jgi:MoaA/NifB/PqqE/SkfB family radical SAM enzyme